MSADALVVFMPSGRRGRVPRGASVLWHLPMYTNTTSIRGPPRPFHTAGYLSRGPMAGVPLYHTLGSGSQTLIQMPLRPP